MAETVEFASNGGSASGYLARPDGGAGPGILVVQEWWGLTPGIREMAASTDRVLPITDVITRIKPLAAMK